MNVIVCRKSRYQLGPALAEVGGLENVGCEVILLVAFDGDIRCTGIVGRSLDHAHRAPIWHGFGRDIFPMLAAIAGEMNQTVVGPGPNQVLMHRRFHHRKNRVVNFDTGVVLGDRAPRGNLF